MGYIMVRSEICRIHSCEEDFNCPLGDCNCLSFDEACNTVINDMMLPDVLEDMLKGVSHE